ncbi:MULTISPECIES: sialate O-acetylesterase [unclassified Lentimonas]|uniref:DUF459 domain-containing protein n=1 Tax=unclassified Lentimonas TaxID=2630993 RepID=UPI001320EF6A|nr:MULTISPECIES: sialate O-acetylesterase [unclassified Lentimonas]CAA6692449.1 Unannotated [Lentimonas sp. CC19]CAA6693483.1 Unannotated [Lentimonas sp. CC10]CAA7070802.1 Unannotated [Lentimonas sp. CC11]
MSIHLYVRRYWQRGSVFGAIFCILFSVNLSAETSVQPNVYAIQAQDRIVFFGDSITAHGARPGGYVDLVAKAVEQAYAEQGIEVIGAGVGGNKVPDLQKRMDRDVLSQKPNLVFIYIGINDVWHWSKPHPVTKAKRAGTTAEAYESGLREIVSKLQAEKITVVLCTPTVIAEQLHPESEDFQRLEQYAAIVRQIAANTDSVLLDLRQLFVDYLSENNPKNCPRGILTMDGVHMNGAGNALIAEAVCRMLGVTAIAESLASNLSAPTKGMDLYLMIGQSNMAGRAKVLDTQRRPIKNCFLFNDRGDWEPATNPLNRFSTVRKDIGMQQLGLGYSFAMKLNEMNPEQTIGLVVNALGGSKIESWQKGQRLYQEALARMEAAQAYGELKAVLWHQGESNFDDAAYLGKLSQLITDLRADLQMPQLPFIVGQITGDYPVNTQLDALPEHVSHTACVSSKDLATQDKWHFNSVSQIQLGERYADAVLSIQQR